MERELDYTACARPMCEEDEGRIDNYCSVFCREVDERDLELAALLRVARAAKELMSEYSRGTHIDELKDALSALPEGMLDD